MSKERSLVVLGQVEVPTLAGCGEKPCMVPLLCKQRLVEGFRCDRCSWAKVFPECHTKWAVPYCLLRESECEFQQHHCSAEPPAGQSEHGAVQ